MTTADKTFLEGQYFAIWKHTFHKQLKEKYEQAVKVGIAGRGFTCFCIIVYEDCPEIIDYSQN